MNPTPSLDPKGEAGSKKTPLHLLPPYALAQTSLAHAEGARKYGLFNWRTNKVCATTYIGAIMRHLTAWQDGEDLDPDSGLTHLAKIAACCNILMDAGHCGTLVDDRSKVPSKAIEKFIEEEQRRFIRECRDVDVLLGEKDSPVKVTQIGGPGSRFEQHGTPAEPASGWGSVTPSHPATSCCNYEAASEDSYPVFWNTFNEVLQCHNCGHQYEPVKPPSVANEPDLGEWLGPVAVAAIEAASEMPPGLPPLPPVPEGYSRWEYRGKGWAGTGPYAISEGSGDEWSSTEGPANACGHDRYHYIEAVK
jgi:hypothetical protein